MTNYRLLLAITALGLGLAATAQATVYQPDNLKNPPSGLLVPLDSKNKEEQLYTFFAANDAQVDWLKDSSPAPDSFSPLCSFTAKFVLKQSGSNLGVGWYNVDPAATMAPQPTDIFTIFPAGTAVGTVVQGQDIRNDSRYKGGLIGFALIGDGTYQYHYSQAKWNIQCTDNTVCSKPAPWIASLSYLSKSTPNQFYVAFEDGNFNSNSFGNDGDYNDYVYQFTGLTCQGGGLPCTVTGVNGICAAGVSQCVVGGGTTCKQIIQPEAVEKCDGLDNDCNGLVDDGASCPLGLTCDRGACISFCGGEFLCPSGLACDNGRCVETACAGVMCADGTSCHGGICTEPCAGIVCPGTQTCRVGRCVDACAGVTCPSGQACQGGACVPGCDCYPCGDPAKGCSKSTNLCVETACVDVKCDAGTICQAGMCVPTCQSAICPTGQSCTAGNCVDIPPAATPDMGDTGTDADTLSGGAVAVTSCGCRLTPTNDTAGGLALGATALMLALGLLRRRRVSA